MKVEAIYRNDTERPMTDPLPEVDGRRFVFRIYSGDVCDPMDGSWFKEPYPTWVLRYRFGFLPFIAWRWPFTQKAAYIGFKLYGVDAPEYKNWIDPAEVYEGSQALCFSIRLGASI